MTDNYPPSLWTEYREEVIPVVMLAGSILVLVGVIFRWQDIVFTALVILGAVMASIFPALFFEYRADMKYDREHPEAQS